LYSKVVAIDAGRFLLAKGLALESRQPAKQTQKNSPVPICCIEHIGTDSSAAGAGAGAERRSPSPVNLIKGKTLTLTIYGKSKANDHLATLQMMNLRHSQFHLTPNETS
jgi:hypothetical protein